MTLRHTELGYTLAAGVVLCCAACGPAVGVSDSGTTTDSGSAIDSGTFTDAGTVFDAGTVVDSGTFTDAGTVADSGTSTDAGTIVDAGTAVDAGTHDAGPADAGESDAGSPAACPANTRAIETVFLIVLENQDWSAIAGSSSAPYINNTLLPMSAYATNYSNPPGIHPSEPNYLWLEAGTNFGILADGTPSTDTQNTTSHLVTLLQNANIPWKSYQESITGTDCPLGGEGAVDAAGTQLYQPKHNPMVYFDDITSSQSSTSQECISHVRPYTELAGDLQSGNVARYNFITPNMCDNGHDDCVAGGNLLTAGTDDVSEQDTWLKNNIPLIMNSNAYKNGGAIFVTWDESEPGLSCIQISPVCPVGMIILSPCAKVGHTSTTAYDHSSTLRTMEDVFSVQPYLGGASSATNLSEFFSHFP